MECIDFINNTRTVCRRKITFSVPVLEDEFGVRHDFYFLVNPSDSRRPGSNVIGGTHLCKGHKLLVYLLPWLVNKFEKVVYFLYANDEDDSRGTRVGMILII